jgi:GxxExxY protein
MPIEHDFQVQVLSQDEFHEMDHAVMRLAFDVQNELGRFYDEKVYHNELNFRLSEQGIGVISEGLIRVKHQDFEKCYYIDLLAQSGALYELKALETLTGGHEGQLLHYLFLLGLNHGKLINFSSPSVTYRFVSTGLSKERRMNFCLNREGFSPSAPKDHQCVEVLSSLLTDWGSFLDVSLYKEALIHFLGSRVDSLEVCIGGRVVGTQQACLLGEHTALHVSAISKHWKSYRKYLERLFVHTDLRQIQWVNFAQNNVDVISLKK